LLDLCCYRFVRACKGYAVRAFECSLVSLAFLELSVVKTPYQRLRFAAKAVERSLNSLNANSLHSQQVSLSLSLLLSLLVV
jgi:hypothetical protein